MERVLLSSIKTLTFYADEQTAARRTSPIPQLTCVGKPCKLFTPDVVQCYNMGGGGSDVQWKCEASLPESMRFGRVDVSCEGWSKPGDPYVLKGSCGLEYRLLQLDDKLRASNVGASSGPSLASYLFWILFLAALLWILYKAFYHTPNPTPGSTTRRPPPQPPRDWRTFFGGFGGGPAGGWGFDHDPPPPYTGPSPKPSTSSAGATGWRPGFWTGLGLGGLAAGMYGARNRQPEVPPQRPREWDWERERLGPRGGGGWLGGWGQPADGVHRRPATAERPQASAGVRRSAQRSPPSSSTWGDLGDMTTSTGFGGSNVR